MLNKLQPAVARSPGHRANRDHAPMRNPWHRVALWLACCASGIVVAAALFRSSDNAGGLLSATATAWNHLQFASPDDLGLRGVVLLDLEPGAVSATQVADVLDLLNYAGARAVLLSMDVGRLASGDESAKRLAAAVARQGSVVLVEGGDEDLGVWSVPAAVRPAAAAVGGRQYHAAANRAILGIRLADDGRAGGPEHAIVATLRVLDPRYRVPERSFFAPPSPTLLLPYGAPPGQFPTVRAAALQVGSAALRELRGKVVVVGSTREHPVATPFDMLASGDRPARRMSEAELAANFTAALAGGRIVCSMAPAEVLVWVPLIVLLCCSPMLVLSPIPGYVASLAAGAAHLGLWWWIGRRALLIFPQAPLALAAVWVSGLLWLAFALWRSRRDVRLLIEQLLSIQAPMRWLGTSGMPWAGRRTPDSLDVAQAALRTAQANRQLADAVIESLPTAVLLVDASGRIVAANRRAGQWFAAVDPIGREALQLLRGLELYVASDADALLREPHHVAECRQGERDLLVDSRLILQDATRSVRMLSFQDVTPVKQATNDRADAVDFLTHDLRTPLNSILVLTGLLEREARAPSETMRRIRTVAQGAIRLADNYVHLLRAAGDTSAAFVEVSLSDVTEEAIAAVQPLALERRIVLRCHDTDPCFVNGDYALLYRALINLLGNAVRHAPDGSVVDVRLDATAQGAQLTVQDDGPGFPSELLQSASGRFRVGKQPKAQGVGLGLALVRAVAHKHGGTLELANVAPHGARVRLALPQIESGAPAHLRAS